MNFLALGVVELSPGLRFWCLPISYFPGLVFDEKFLKHSGVSPTSALAARKVLLHRTSEKGDLSILAQSHFFERRIQNIFAEKLELKIFRAIYRLTSFDAKSSFLELAEVATLVSCSEILATLHLNLTT